MDIDVTMINELESAFKNCLLLLLGSLQSGLVIPRYTVEMRL